jgi:hypothetical protein
MKEMNLEGIPGLASMTLPWGDRRFCPAIVKQEKEGGGYSIRILVSSSQNFRSGGVSNSWDYFTTDAEGVITQCPRGMTKEFKGWKIRDIEAKVEEYKDKRINHA